jgi:hypothetical protein
MRCFAAAVLLPILAAPASAAPSGGLALLPDRVTLDGPASRARVVPTRIGAAGPAGIIPGARLRAANPGIVRVLPDGALIPLADGTTVVEAVAPSGRATARVIVTGFRAARPPDFGAAIIPVLTREGCNSGACHGAAAGKGGLRLTLRGYDPAADHLALTRQALARRITLEEPERSLVLLKASGGIGHGGGRRFARDSDSYRLIRDWIRAGAPGPDPRRPKLERIEVLPVRATLRPKGRQQLVVLARYAGGRVADVTRWAKFTAADDAVAGVDDHGMVTCAGPGEAPITVWYSSHVAFARVTSPHPKPVPATAFSAAPAGEIDRLVLDKLRELRIPPAPACTDEEFIRRAFLDAAGILPAPEEVERFLVGCREERLRNGGRPPRAAREALIEALLSREEFVDYWSYRWSDLLLVSSRRLPARAMWAFYGWIRAAVKENRPWDRMVREIVTAAGSNLENGAANYYVLHKDPTDLTETTSQAFLGMSLTCARCHNHPLEKWTQTDYYGMANLFARVRLKNGEIAGETIVFDAPDGDVPHPRTGRPMPPRPLDGQALSLDGPAVRREHLADWLTAPGNPYVARALVNRVWRALMGRGLVEAEDDLRLTNPPSNQALMDRLAGEFVRSGYDVKGLIRTIMRSEAYQRSSRPARGSPADDRYYSTYLPRRLPAEVLLDAIAQVTGVPSEFPGYPRGTRALQLPDSEVASNFLSAFGRPQRAQTCSCERQEEPSVAQALHLSNGETINERVRHPESRVTSWAKLEAPGEILDRVYLAALSRRPAPAERARVLAALGSVGRDPAARREAVEDLVAALLTTREFLFNH